MEIFIIMYELQGADWVHPESFSDGTKAQEVVTEYESQNITAWIVTTKLVE